MSRKLGIFAQVGDRFNKLFTTFIFGVRFPSEHDLNGTIGRLFKISGDPFGIAEDQIGSLVSRESASKPDGQNSSGPGS